MVSDLSEPKHTNWNLVQRDLLLFRNLRLFAEVHHLKGSLTWLFRRVGNQFANLVFRLAQFLSQILEAVLSELLSELFAVLAEEPGKLIVLQNGQH